MNLETLAQDIFDKKEDVTNKQLALSKVKIALSEAKTALSNALCTNESTDEQVAINLKDHVVICEWDGDSEYTMTFVPKIPNVEI